MYNTVTLTWGSGWTEKVTEAHKIRQRIALDRYGENQNRYLRGKLVVIKI